MNPNYNFADRKEFLFQMYNQLCAEIDRHINFIWQSVGVLLSTFAIFALVEKNIITMDLAASIIILVSALSIAIVIESNYWYNRNLVMIANIERQFLLDSDTKDIHYYFKSHRKNNAYLDMMVIQICFILVLLLIIVLYHFWVQVWPFRCLEIKHFDLLKVVPYITLVIGSILLILFHRKRIKNYNEFKANSPGIEVGGSAYDSNSDHITN
jgi:hypothetical protein